MDIQSIPYIEKKSNSPLVKAYVGLAPAVDPGLYRLYLMLQHLDNGSGCVPLSAVYSQFNDYYGHTPSQRTVRRWLASGAGTYWTVKAGRIYYTAWKKLHTTLLENIADERGYDVAEACRVQTVIHISLQGTAQEFTARLYAAWVDTRNKEGRLTVSRDFLCKVWNRSVPTLRAWETAAGVTSEANFAQYAGGNEALVPDHAVPYQARRADGKTENRMFWQRPNTYSVVQRFTPHAHGGQVKKIRKARRAVLDLYKPAELSRGGLLRTGRLNFERDNVLDAFKAADRHLRKHGDIDRGHYVKVGETRRAHIWELVDPTHSYQQTQAGERLYAAERDAFFQDYRAAFLRWDVGWTKTLPTNRVSDCARTDTLPRTLVMRIITPTPPPSPARQQGTTATINAAMHAIDRLPVSPSVRQSYMLAVMDHAKPGERARRARVVVAHLEAHSTVPTSPRDMPALLPFRRAPWTPSKAARMSVDAWKANNLRTPAQPTTPQPAPATDRRRAATAHIRAEGYRPVALEGLT